MKGQTNNRTGIKEDKPTIGQGLERTKLQQDNDLRGKTYNETRIRANTLAIGRELVRTNLKTTRII